MKPEIGQRVFHLNIGKAARGREQVLTPYVVTKVGRKYFTARREDDERGWTDTQYHLDSWIQKTEYSADSRIYANPQQWEDSKEEAALRNKLREVFAHGYRGAKLSLEQLREIDAIVSR